MSRVAQIRCQDFARSIPRALEQIQASFDPVAVDAVGSRLLGHDPSRIDYLRLAHGRLGDMHHLEIVTDGAPRPLAIILAKEEAVGKPG